MILNGYEFCQKLKFKIYFKHKLLRCVIDSKMVLAVWLLLLSRFSPQFLHWAFYQGIQIYDHNTRNALLGHAPLEKGTVDEI